MFSYFPKTAAAGLAAAAVLTACAGENGTASDPDGELQIVAAMYALEFLADEIAGERAEVTSLTPAGVDPHDLELTTSAVVQLDEAVVVYLSGFQAAVDDAVAATDPMAALDVAGPADVTAFDADGQPIEGTSVDPHFWLDFDRMSAVAEYVAAELGEIDPEGAEHYAERAEALQADFAALDAEYSEGLAECETRTVVAAHEAYGYLAYNYDLEQMGLSGLDPESEPSPARLAEVRRVVEASGVSTIYAEDLINPAVAEAFAQDLGISVAMLDPAEMEPEGGDYRQAMRDNLEALREGLGCA
ncbi:metal ABC transporter substrate-binding protein [Bogoriella caseilytica]|uniref:Zinc transport system substrate-binding protein n=1 Tax=Bogoriella caseilytica TaxID=56055 RepID=A0A3N2BGC0_9MICO|nr:metal ABC transporter substrate-binding protein [Bogoriella caseilytica]ROR74104.1 zinc transport system substrate-binding protein [Bogoriella caseilytica]